MGASKSKPVDAAREELDSAQDASGPRIYTPPPQPSTSLQYGVEDQPLVTNVNSVAFSYQAVQNAYVPLFYFGTKSDNVTNVNLYFAGNVPFYMANSILKAVNIGGICTDASKVCYSRDQTTVENSISTTVGTFLTNVHYTFDDIKDPNVETAPTSLPVYMVEKTSPYLTEYSFAPYIPKAGEYPNYAQGGPVIHLQATQKDAKGKVTQQGYVICDPAAASGVYRPAKIVATVEEVVALQVQYGIITTPFNPQTAQRTPANLATLLMYADKNLGTGALPFTMICGTGNTQNNLLVPQRNNGQDWVNAGVFTTAEYYPSFLTSQRYSKTNMRFVNNTTIFTAKNVESYTEMQRMLWVLTGIPSNVAGMSVYMDTFCSDLFTSCVVTNLTNIADKTRPLCTAFFAAGPIGQSCRDAAGINSTATNSKYRKLCGVNPETKFVETTDPTTLATKYGKVLSTADCSCVNYLQSTYKQPSLMNMTYEQFNTWLKTNSLPTVQTEIATCWWPSCTNKLSFLTTSDMNEDLVCPNIVNCIAAVAGDIELSADSKLTLNVKNACSNNGKDVSLNPNLSGSGGLVPPGTSPSASGEPETPLTQQPWFLPVVIGGSIIVLIIIIIIAVAVTNKKKKDKVIPIQSPPVAAPQT